MSLNVTSADPISMFMIFDEIQYSTSFLLQAPDYYIPMLVLAAVFLTGGTLSTILLVWFIFTDSRKGCLIYGTGFVFFLFAITNAICNYQNCLHNLISILKFI